METSEQREIYLPAIVGGGYGAFWRSRHRYRVVKGGKGSKKSCTAALWYIVHLMRYPGANLLVVRNVYATLRSSCFAQLKWAIDRLGVSHLWKAAENPLKLTYLPTGQCILFRGMDQVDKLASTTVETGYLCWVWIEEAYEIAREEDFDKLDLSVPRGLVPPPLFKQTTLTFNPWSAGHWLKARFFDAASGPGDRDGDGGGLAAPGWCVSIVPDAQEPESGGPDSSAYEVCGAPEGIATAAAPAAKQAVHDGASVLAMTTTYACNEFLDDTDRAVFDRMRREQPRRYAVAGLGEWGVAEGAVFERWEVRPFDPACLRGEGFRHVFGLDYGYTNDPTAFMAAAVEEEAGVIWIYDEHYEKRMLLSDIAAMVTRKGYAKERIRADAAEPRTNEELRRRGLTRLRAAAKGPDSLRSGIARIQEYRLVVHPSCRHTAAELAAYVWEQGPDGPRNHPADRDNHLMDALRYAMQDAPLAPRAARVRSAGDWTLL